MNKIIAAGLAVGLGLASGASFAGVAQGAHLWPVTGSITVNFSEPDNDMAPTKYVVKSVAMTPRVLMLAMRGVEDPLATVTDPATLLFLKNNVIAAVFNFDDGNPITDDDGCTGELVTYDKVQLVITGELARINTCDSNSADGYALTGTNVAAKSINIVTIDFYEPDDVTQKTDHFNHTNLIQGGVAGVATFNFKTSGGELSAVSNAAVKNLLGSLSYDGDGLVAVAGSFSINFSTNVIEGTPIGYGSVGCSVTLNDFPSSGC